MRTQNRYTEEQLQEAVDLVESHNAQIGETSKTISFYMVDVTGHKSVYYTLYRFNPQASKNPYSYLGNLSTDLMQAVQKICTGRGLKVELITTDNFNPEFPKSGLLSFGKHKDKSLDQIYSEDPGYVLWLASKFEPRTKHMADIVQHAKHIAEAHWQMVTEQNKAECTSQYIGSVGERLDLELSGVTVSQFQVEGWGFNRIETRYLVKGQDADGNLIKFYTSHHPEDESIKVRGTVKDHQEKVGRKWTVLTRVKVG